RVPDRPEAGASLRRIRTACLPCPAGEQRSSLEDLPSDAFSRFLRLTDRPEVRGLLDGLGWGKVRRRLIRVLAGSRRWRRFVAAVAQVELWGPPGDLTIAISRKLLR